MLLWTEAKPNGGGGRTTPPDVNVPPDIPDQLLVPDHVWGPFSSSQVTLIILILAGIALAATAYALYVASRSHRVPSHAAPIDPAPDHQAQQQEGLSASFAEILLDVAATPPHLDPRPTVVSALRRMGFAELAVSIGEEFDPRLHKAVGTTETLESSGGRTVIESIVRPGWTRDGVLVQAAEVVTRRR